jgi:hypothetical protein
MSPTLSQINTARTTPSYLETILILSLKHGLKSKLKLALELRIADKQLKATLKFKITISTCRQTIKGNLEVEDNIQHHLG